MKLETERLFLREMTHADVDHLRSTLQDIRVMYAWEHAFSDAEVCDWIERNIRRYRTDGHGYWLAFDRQTGEAVGQIGLLKESFFGHDCLGVGWLLRQASQGRGYATEGARACLDHAFRELGAQRVAADIRPMNRPSCRVAERLGMRSCGSFDKVVGGVVMPHRIYCKRSPCVHVLPYDARWAADFERLAALLAPVVNRYRCRLVHVGSTSVPGLAAKPVIDADLVLAAPEDFDAVREALAPLGFEHQPGTMIPGREMFGETLRLPFLMNFYVCTDPNGTALRNHLALRDYLRSHPEDMERYGALKRSLAVKYPEDVDAYCEAKSDLIGELLLRAGMPASETAEIHRQNQLPPDHLPRS